VSKNLCHRTCRRSNNQENKDEEEASKERRGLRACAAARQVKVERRTFFQQILQQYAIERFLYRVSKSKHAQDVVLRGALLLKTIGIPRERPTMDIDMLRKGKADPANLIALVKGCATLDVEADGLTFLADSVVAEEITKDSEYKGTRVLMYARMDNVRLRIQIDFGVGDVMVPGSRMIEYPAFLTSDTIQLLAYPVESAIAEKLPAMAALGNANSPFSSLERTRVFSQWSRTGWPRETYERS
jgi:nucleotidyltransferase AbiEii toxin of type IV toxin-antitoxin system